MILKLEMSITLLFSKISNGIIIIVLVYVDDVIIISNNMEEIKKR
jgi:hypothetical protein